MTDLPFFFDHEGDGRPHVDKYLMHKIKNLALSDCKELTDHGISEISRRCSSLESINLTGCTKLTDAGVTALTVDVQTGATRGQFLKELDLTFCIKVTDAGIANLMKRCQRNLQTLHLSGCIEISDECIQMLSKECGGLQNVSFGHMRLLTDAGLKALADNLWLEEINVSHCLGITDKGMVYVANESPGLRILSLAYCRKLTDVTVHALADNCKLLRRIDLSNCDALSDGAVARLEALAHDTVVIRGKAQRDKDASWAGGGSQPLELANG